MTKLKGHGTIIELVKNKKYRLAFSAGKNPATGIVYKSSGKVPDNACAIDEDGKFIHPRIEYKKASAEQKNAYSQWKTPIEYLRWQETFYGTKNQAKNRLEEIKHELEHGRSVDIKKYTLAAWIDDYLSNRESIGRQRPKTLETERNLSKHIIRRIGSILLVDVTPIEVDSLFKSMREDGVGDTTIKQCYRLLKAALKKATAKGLITKNPVDGADVPKNPIPKRQCLNYEDAVRLGAICASGTPTANKTAVYLGLATGARLGEILGLEWQHIVLDDKPHIFFIQQHTGNGELTPMKTDKGDNPLGGFVPIDDSTISVLLAWKTEQRKQLYRFGIEQGNDTPVITSKVGTFVNHSNFENWWRGFCVDNGFGRMVADDGREIVRLTIGDDDELYLDEEYIIEWRDSEGWPCDEHGNRYSRSNKRPKIAKRYDGLRFHALRHTHFSLRLASGDSITTCQYLGRWTSPAMLVNVYSHPVEEYVWKSAGFMDRLNAGNIVRKEF